MTGGFGLAVTPPRGFTAAIRRRPVPVGATGDAPADGARTRALVDTPHPVVHVATIALPEERGDFGGGVLPALGRDDVFVALVEYDASLADTGLFAKVGMPRLAPSQFGFERMPRQLPPRSACQHFFSLGGRAFCLFTVIGDHSRRMALVPRAAEVVRTLRVTDADTLRRLGGMP
ncbi:MAG TPA: hypothetical protein VES95_00395 [Dermatophilaceae bacterium]|nr:hypothetical protein [Dermatophilaceae bacterium]